MSPALASLLAVTFIAFLFRREIKDSRELGKAIWIPTLWFLIVATRAVTSWLATLGFSVGGISVEDGSTVDAFVYFVLIVAGLRVLIKRRVTVAELIRSNPWLSVYLLYCLASIFWSDFPGVAMKRWLKDLGIPIMVLVLLTDTNPLKAVSSFFKRCSFIIVPVSILFIKYYPALGRGFDTWTGRGFYTGITENKNILGGDLLILGLFFVWYSMMTFRQEASKARRSELVLCVGFLGMIYWLLLLADSKTPLMCLLVGAVILIASGLKFLNTPYIGAYIVLAALLYFAADATFDLYDQVLGMLGRDATLTTRTSLWAELERWPINPLVGTGFESFWLGERRQTIWALTNWEPSEAHNGYLETYLNLGLLGLFLMLVFLFGSYYRACRSVSDEAGFGRFRLAFVCLLLLYNWTEAALGGLHVVWFTFILTALEYHPLKSRYPHSSSDLVLLKHSYNPGRPRIPLNAQFGR